MGERMGLQPPHLHSTSAVAVDSPERIDEIGTDRGAGSPAARTEINGKLQLGSLGVIVHAARPTALTILQVSPLKTWISPLGAAMVIEHPALGENVCCPPGHSRNKSITLEMILNV